MSNCRLMFLIIAAATVLAACGGAPAPQIASSLPTAARTSSVPTAAIVPTVASAATFEGLSSGLDNATQARIRATSAVPGTPNADVFVNGLPAFNGGKAQQNLAVGQISGWLYVTPGTYTVALVPHGGTLAQALFAPVAVNAAAGHRFTVAAIGQMKDHTVKSLVVDETALEAGISAEAVGNTGTVINNLTGVASVDRLVDGKLAMTIPVGAAQAAPCRNGTTDKTIHEAYSVSGKPESIFASADFWCGPQASSLMTWYGDYPNDVNGSSDSQATSELNTLDFLASFTHQHIATDDGHVLTFKTLLAAIDTAGMRDLFARSDPYFFFAPTDEAFAAVPKAQLAALLNDPQALTTLIKTHFIPGYYPFGTLFSASAAPEVTNVLGQKLRMTEIGNGVDINGVHVLGVNYTVANGNRVHLVNKLLPAK